MLPVPDAVMSRPVVGRSHRRSQMRRLAKLFSVELEDGRTGEEAVTRRLRLMSNPLFQAGSGQPRMTGIFAFVEGTDPEAVLVLEVRDSKDNSEQWHFGFARMNIFALTGRFRNQTVWEVPRLVEYIRPHETFTSHIIE